MAALKHDDDWYLVSCPWKCGQTRYVHWSEVDQFYEWWTDVSARAEDAFDKSKWVFQCQECKKFYTYAICFDYEGEWDLFLDKCDTTKHKVDVLEASWLI